MSVVLSVVDGKKVVTTGVVTFLDEANVYLAQGGFRFRRSTQLRRSIDGDVFMIEFDLPVGDTAAGLAKFDLADKKYEMLYTLRRNSQDDPATLTAEYTLMVGL